MRFCQTTGKAPLPLTQDKLVAFVAVLAQQGLKHQSIKCYLSALRYYQIAANMSDPFQAASFPYLEYVLKGVKKLQAMSAPQRRPRLPITPTILRQLLKHWNKSAQDTDTKMLWAACCLGFFGFLRAGEFTVVAENAVDLSVCLTPADVAIDCHTNPKIMKVRIKASKTDPYRQGVDIYLGRTQKDLCPLVAMLAYLAVRGSQMGPLFTFKDGKPLTRQKLVLQLRQALKAVGIDDTKYSGHSFRIGAATTAAAVGVEDSTIQMLGRWKSSAYLSYIRTPRDQLAAISHRLV